MTTEIAFTAFTPDGWSAMRRLADDGDTLGDYATAATEIEAMRHEPVAMLVVDAAAVLRMHEWCAANGHKLDADGRVAWIFAMARLLNDPAGRA